MLLRYCAVKIQRSNLNRPVFFALIDDLTTQKNLAAYFFYLDMWQPNRFLNQVGEIGVRLRNADYEFLTHAIDVPNCQAGRAWAKGHNVDGMLVQDFHISNFLVRNGNPLDGAVLRHVVGLVDLEIDRLYIGISRRGRKCHDHCRSEGRCNIF